MARPNGFDKLARVYRWLEYCSFGPLLWRTRTHYLSAAVGARNALVLGDGDGRFTAALLRSTHSTRVIAVDASGAMLQQLVQRATRQGNAGRVHARLGDALAVLPTEEFDLVCTHFFLDCLSTTQCHLLAARVAQQMQPGARWVLSEFAVPEGVARWPASMLVAALYLAFGLLTGLRIRKLPDYAAALQSAGFERAAVKIKLLGILRSELWTLQGELDFVKAKEGASNAV